jgi:rRNA maturation protein Rpf1
MDALPYTPNDIAARASRSARHLAERLTKSIAGSSAARRYDTSSIGGLAIIVLDVRRACVLIVVRDDETVPFVCASMQRE